MKCPLCNANMKLHFTTVMHEGIRGFTQVYSCTKCQCTVDLVVRDNMNMHESLNDPRNDN